MKRILTKLFEYENLSREEARSLLHGIAEGKYNNSQISGLMTVYLMRNISLDELTGFRDALMELKKPLNLSSYNAIDIVGTGGDGKDTFNISTCSSFVVAAAGYQVVKHGNYGSTSVSGASNVIEYHGVKFTSSEETIKKSLDKTNMAYLHAPLFNPAMKAVASMRKEMGVRTFFNILGPLINPAEPKNQLLGVYNLSLQRMYSYMLQKMNTNYAVVYALDGYDEISLTSNFKVCKPNLEKIYSPDELGFSLCKDNDLFGGETIAEASQIFDNVLQGKSTKSQRDCVVANSAFAISLFESEKSIAECIEIAKEAIDSGRAWKNFQLFVSLNC